MTASHRSANQRYFMHNSATVHRRRMHSTALDSSRSELCNDTSTGVVRHQITKWRRLQKVASYDVLHHSGSTALYQFGLCLSVVPHFSTIVSSTTPSERAAAGTSRTFGVCRTRMPVRICPTGLFACTSLQLEQKGKEALRTDWQCLASFRTFGAP